MFCEYPTVYIIRVHDNYVSRGVLIFFFFKQKTAYEIETDWSSDVCSSDLPPRTACFHWARWLHPAPRHCCRRENPATGSCCRCLSRRRRSYCLVHSYKLTCHLDASEIGRASCRERVKMEVDGVSYTKHGV